MQADELDPAHGGAKGPSEALNPLVLECVQRFESEGDAAIDDVCARHPEHSARLRARIDTLRAMGLLGAGAHARVDTWPERLGDFRLLERLGGGGMGVVYLAEQLSLRRRVALKLIRPEQLFFPGARERFHREVDAIARLAHPGIVPVYVVGEERGVPYFAMEHVHGKSLADVIVALRDRSPERLRGRDLLLAAGGAQEALPAAFDGDWTEACVRLARDVALALHHAHERGVLHRDVKPSNVMLTTDGRALLLDFGLATFEGSSALTRTGAQQGSLPYMSPEQVDGRVSSLDARTDVYALGVTLYELLTLRAPFAAESSEQLMRRITTGSTVPARKLNPGVSADLAAVCATAMDVEPRRRYASAFAFASDLDNVLELRPIAARPATAARQFHRWVRRHPSRAAALALLALLVIGGPIVFGIQRSRAAERERAERDIATVQRQRAEANLADALAAVDTMLARVGNERLADVPQMENVRRELLEDALRFYAKLHEREPADAAMRVARSRTGIAMAQVLQLLGRSAEAQGAYESEISSLRELLATDPTLDTARTELARALNGSAGVAMDSSDVPRARTAAAEAVALWTELGRKPGGHEARLNQATSEANLGALLQDCGDTAGAALSFASATRAAEQVFALEPRPAEAGEVLARVLDKQALYLSANGDLVAARTALERALALQRELVGERGGDQDRRAALIDMSVDLGALLVQQRHADQAESVLRDASVAAMRMVADFPNTPGHVSRLGEVRVQLGLLLLNAERLDEAQPELEAALRLFEGLVDDHPDSLAHRGSLGMALLDIGAPLVQLGEFDAGREYLERSIACFELVIAAAPNRANYRRSLALARLNLANGWIEQGEHATAAHELADVASALGSDAPRLRALARLWSRCAALADEDARMLDAERAARRDEYLQQALASLLAALDAGYANATDVLTAPDLELVREMPGFESVRAKLEGAAAR